jgi:hypothetical protein
MSTKAYDIPQGTAAVSPNGRLTPPFHAYLAGVADCSKRVAAAVAPLDGSATLADVIAKQNELIAALKIAGLMHED